MDTARTHCIALTGIECRVVEIQAETGDGPPGLTLASMAEPGMWETRDRVRAATINSGETWPEQRLTIIVPATPGGGSHYDLPIAVAVLAAAGFVAAPPPEVVLLGELGLDGRLHRVRGVLPAVQAATAAGYGEVIVPQDNVAEASLVTGIRVTSADSLAAVLAHLRGVTSATQPLPCVRATHAVVSSHQQAGDLADLMGQQPAKYAAEVCAAGGHHLLLTGPHHSGTALMAERIGGLLPPLDLEAALEVTALHSLAGLLMPDDPLISRPPFIAHNFLANQAIMTGSACPAWPGSVSLAHRGILFLEQAPEFDREVLDILRQPLEYGEIVSARGRQVVHWPAAFTLVMTACSCPCGNPDQECGCTPLARRRYLGRLAGPLTSRIDLTAIMTPPVRMHPGVSFDGGDRSGVAAERVAAARQCAADRLAGTPWQLNAQVPGHELRRRFPLAPGTLAVLDRAVELGEVSAFGAGRTLAVAWTLADLAGLAQPGPMEVIAALALRLGRST